MIPMKHKGELGGLIRLSVRTEADYAAAIAILKGQGRLKLTLPKYSQLSISQSRTLFQTSDISK